MSWPIKYSEIQFGSFQELFLKDSWNMTFTTCSSLSLAHLSAYNMARALAVILDYEDENLMGLKKQQLEEAWVPEDCYEEEQPH